MAKLCLVLVSHSYKYLFQGNPDHTSLANPLTFRWPCTLQTSQARWAGPCGRWSQGPCCC